MSRSPLLMASAGVAAILTMITGCGQIKASLPPMERVINIATESAREPETWVPLTAAAALLVTGADDTISDWASDHTPIFGSQNSAASSSDTIKNALVAGMVISSIFTPTSSADTTFPTRRVAANALAFGTIAGIVEAGKLTVERRRPNDRDDKSFPSGHSSGAFSSAYLIEQNLNAHVQQPWLRKTIKVGTVSSAAAVAWARIEAKEHFPVDVLVSAALSNFIVKTFYRSIVTEGRSAVPPIAVEASRQGLILRVAHTF